LGQKFGTPHPEKSGVQNIKIWDKFGQLRSLIVNISGMKHGIIEQKMALQTAL